MKCDRPGLKQAFEFLREGDTLVVWRLDWLGRSHKHFIALVKDLQDHKISFRQL